MIYRRLVVIFSLINPPPCNGQVVAQSQFLNGVKLVSIQSFSSVRQVAKLKLKNCLFTQLFINNWKETKRIYTFSKGISLMWNATDITRIWNRVTNSIFYDDNRKFSSSSRKKTNKTWLDSWILYRWRGNF